MHSRDGFTIIELLIVILLAGIVAGIAIPQVGRAVAKNRLDRAASVVSADLKLAYSMAARQRQPVRVEVDSVGRRMVVRNAGSPATVFSERNMGDGSELAVQRMVSHTTSQVLVYPSGLASGPLEIELRAGGSTRSVTMSRAGQIRVR
ncbi:MAG TPA: GspH/FimT family pseudopilin [Longimicrobiales bacterium]|nr:GspH/FimT family pseudopilin [Longimicrobiales bacterium]